MTLTTYVYIILMVLFYDGLQEHRMRIFQEFLEVL